MLICEFGFQVGEVWEGKLKEKEKSRISIRFI